MVCLLISAMHIFNGKEEVPPGFRPKDATELPGMTEKIKKSSANYSKSLLNNVNEVTTA